MHHGHVFYLKGPSWRLRGRVLEAQEAGGVRPAAESAPDAANFSPQITPTAIDSFIRNQSQEAAKGDPS